MKMGWLLMAVWLSACSSQPAASLTVTATASLPPLQVYARSTATITPTPQRTPADTPAPVLPTPTPFLYTVVKEDTMLGIALRYGITVDELIAANPQVDPRFMSVGARLVIPLEGELAPLEASPTPLAVQLSQPFCYPRQDGLLCYILAEHSQAAPLESLAALVTLRSSTGETLDSRPAYSALALHKPGEKMPLLAVFPAPPDSPFTASAQLLTALPSENWQERYTPLEVSLPAARYSQDGRTAFLKVQVTADQPLTQLELAVTAFDSSGAVVGLRTIKLQQGLEDLLSEPLSIEVYSLGAPIERVEVLAEARP